MNMLKIRKVECPICGGLFPVPVRDLSLMGGLTKFQDHLLSHDKTEFISIAENSAKIVELNVVE